MTLVYRPSKETSLSPRANLCDDPIDLTEWQKLLLKPSYIIHLVMYCKDIQVSSVCIFCKICVLSSLLLTHDFLSLICRRRSPPRGHHSQKMIANVTLLIFHQRHYWNPLCRKTGTHDMQLITNLKVPLIIITLKPIHSSNSTTQIKD